MNDTISDLLVRVSNAQRAGRFTFDIPFSRIKVGILEVLREERYISEFKTDDDKKTITIELSDSNKSFEKIRRVSRPGRRSYIKSKNIPRPRGYGMVIISTPKGVLSGKKARAAGLGGELICEVF